MNSLDSAVDDFAGLIVEETDNDVRIKPINKVTIRAEKNRIIRLLDNGVNPNPNPNSINIAETPLSKILVLSSLIESKKGPGVSNVLSEDDSTFLESTIADIVTKLLEKGAIVDEDIQEQYRGGSLPEYINELLAPHIPNNNQPGLNQANNGQKGGKKGRKSRTRNRKAKTRKGARRKRVRHAKTRKASRRS
jgi:hypothetical protein